MLFLSTVRTYLRRTVDSVSEIPLEPTQRLKFLETLYQIDDFLVDIEHNSLTMQLVSAASSLVFEVSNFD
jgi:hypothetical protein